MKHTVEQFANDWRNLRAWGAPLPMTVKIEPYKGQHILGLAWSCQGRAMVRLTGSIARDLATLLHELAHLAAPNSEHHGARWREVYIRAAAEALDCSVDDFDPDVTKGDLDQQVMDMVEVWLDAC